MPANKRPARQPIEPVADRDRDRDRFREVHRNRSEMIMPTGTVLSRLCVEAASGVDAGVSDAIGAVVDKVLPTELRDRAVGPGGGFRVSMLPEQSVAPGVSVDFNDNQNILDTVAFFRPKQPAMATFKRVVTSSLLACGLASILVGTATAADCAPGAPVPYGLIGDTWRSAPVKDRIGCPTEPEHDVPGRKGRLQSFQRGQIAWTPDQGPRMTIWAIRDKAHFRVQWSSNDQSWSYDKYLIRWDRDGKNVGQLDISGTTEGWWDFNFDTPGVYTFVVEGRSGGGYHHGWTIPVGGILPPGDVPPPSATPMPPPPSPPNITVSYQSGAYIVKGSNFLRTHRVHIRVADDALNPNLFYVTTSDPSGAITDPLTIPCRPGVLHFSANDERANSHDLTGTLWSNTFTMNCQ